MKRFYVCRHYLKWKGKMYKKGDLLPENFTHHDKARSIYNSRIGECEVPDNNNEMGDTSAEASVAEGSVQGPEATKPAPPISTSEKGTKIAAEKPKFNFNQPLTGTQSK